MSKSEVYNEDCMAVMARYPDKYFDLAVVDPPYGCGIHKMSYTKTGLSFASQKSAARCRDYRNSGEWDIKPAPEYFTELQRVSKRQIIWGGNYFADVLPPSKCFIVWDKRCSNEMRNDFADCEYAWISPDLGVARVFRFVWNGMLQGNMRQKEERFHPTQKPVALYEWLLVSYAKPGDKILDTHMGSQSSRIAAYRLGYDYVGAEISPEFFRKGNERFERETAQECLFL